MLDFMDLKGSLIFSWKSFVIDSSWLRFAKNMRNGQISFDWKKEKQFFFAPFKFVVFSIKSVTHLVEIAYGFNSFDWKDLESLRGFDL